MRIVNKKEFCALPEGTVFLFDADGYYEFNELSIKGATLMDGADFIYQRLTVIDADSSEQFFDRVDRMRESSDISYALDLECTQRGGHMDDSTKYMVLERADLGGLLALLTQATKAYPEQG